MEEALEQHPLSIQQHGFQRGKCTESAISKTTNYLEKHTEAGQHCLAVFLDIKGAFDTICPKHIRKTLRQKGINKDLIEWYYNYITHRNLEFKDIDYPISGTIDTGFPQGEVCSAKFLIIAFDYTLELINTEVTEGQGFADDLCILTHGTNLSVMQNRMQSVINNLVTKSREAKLPFSPEKTVAMVFSPKKERSPLACASTGPA